MLQKRRVVKSEVRGPAQRARECEAGSVPNSADVSPEA